MHGSSTKDLTEMNRSLIITLLQQRGTCTRVELAQATGLTQAAITKIINVLVGLGVVQEVGSVKGKANRRSIGLRLVPEKYKVIGIKFSRRAFDMGVFDISGHVYCQNHHTYSLQDSPEKVFGKIKKQADVYLGREDTIVAVGAAVPGPYLRHEGRFSLITQMPEWKDINFKEQLGSLFTQPVFVEHDANAGALAEWWFGKRKASKGSLCYFLVGEGVGAGIVEDGRLVLGSQGIAGEIGHVSLDVNGPACECGNRGCLELYCSVPAVLAAHSGRPGERKAGHAPKVEDIFAAARGGEGAALQTVDTLARTIGYGCVTLINAYNPDTIVIGDLVTPGKDLMLETIRETVKQRVVPSVYQGVEIRFTGFAVDPILYGASAIATSKIVKRPSTFL